MSADSNKTKAVDYTLERFQELIFQELAKLIRRSRSGGAKFGFPQGSGAFLLGLGPRPKAGTLAPREHFLIKVSMAFVEIFESYAVIKDIGVYVRQFPYGRSGVSKYRHLAYHITQYLQELNILNERMKTLVTVLRRTHRPARGSDFDRALRRVLLVTSISLHGPLKARHRHVHEERFEDEDLYRLQGLEGLATSGSEFGEIYDEEYRRVRKKWSNQLERDRGAIKHLLDDYFSKLYPWCFTEAGELRVPSRYCPPGERQ